MNKVDTLVFIELILLIVFLKYCTPAEDTKEEDLFLTPLIRSGQLAKAKAAAEDIPDAFNIEPVKSYSGYLTIDEKFNSNLFFWFFPAQENPEKAPVILWVSELPGYACIRGVFLENGPFLLDEGGNLRNRPLSWVKKYSVLYIDAPVGTGFSFADSPEAYAENSEDEASEIHEGLLQFFTLFKEYQGLDFYLAGRSYAGTVIPNIAKYLHKENQKSALRINLKGCIIGSPWVEPLRQTYTAEFYKDLGLIDSVQYQVLKSVEDQYHGAIEENNTILALDYSRIIYTGPKSLLAKFTGFTDFHNALTTKEPEEIQRVSTFVDSKLVHNYLHVGLHKFQSVSPIAGAKFATDFIASHIRGLEDMLNHDYKVLIYSSQFDLQETHRGITEVVNNLKWKGAKEYGKAQRKIWKVNGDVAGYVKQALGLTYVFIRNAGNYVLAEQPVWTIDMLDRFMDSRAY